MHGDCACVKKINAPGHFFGATHFLFLHKLSLPSCAHQKHRKHRNARTFELLTSRSVIVSSEWNVLRAASTSLGFKRLFSWCLPAQRVHGEPSTLTRAFTHVNAILYSYLLNTAVISQSPMFNVLSFGFTQPRLCCCFQMTGQEILHVRRLDPAPPVCKALQPNPRVLQYWFS